MDNVDILNKLSEGNSSDWLKKAEWRKQNESWLDFSAEIALQIISALKKEGKTKKDLAKEMGVSPQNISKLLSGSANFCLETISKFEKILNIDLIQTVDNSILKNDFKNEMNTNIIISFKSEGYNYNDICSKPSIQYNNSLLAQA